VKPVGLTWSGDA